MLTLLSCGQGQNGSYIDALILQFKTRVLADGGTFEAQSCLKTTLETLGIVVPPTVVTAPVISGSTAIGSVISTTNGVFDGVTPITYTYQWLLDGSPILGATSSTYTTENLGTLTCKVTATNDFGSASSTSNSLELIPLLLDTYTNAAVAYSLRKLRTDYVGSVIRVRRASDNSEMNIGFVNNELDIVTLTTFCSGTNGFVTTWYDQSGNANHATQSTAASQPKIVDGGVLVTENGIQGIKWDGVNDLLRPTSFLPASSDFAVFSVIPKVEEGRFSVWSQGSNASVDAIISYANDSNAGNVTRLFVAQVATLGTDHRGQKLLLTITRDGNVFDLIENGDVVNTLTKNINISPLNATIGAITYTGPIYTIGTISELILYPSDQSTNRTPIETNINDYYEIY